MRTLIAVVCVLLVSGCANTIYLKAEQEGVKCEARANGLFTTSMANNRFEQCLGKPPEED